MTNKAIVNGAMCDFIGYLTTRPEVIKVGASETVYAIHDIYREWADMRGLDFGKDEAAVMDWNTVL